MRVQEGEAEFQLLLIDLRAEHPFVQRRASFGLAIELKEPRPVLLGDNMHDGTVDGQHPHGAPIDQQQFLACKTGHLQER